MDQLHPILALPNPQPIQPKWCSIETSFKIELQPEVETQIRIEMLQNSIRKSSNFRSHFCMSSHFFFLQPCHQIYRQYPEQVAQS